MNQATEKKSIKEQSAWLLFAKTAAFGFSFLLPLLVVRYLNQESVGLYRESFLVIMNAVNILPLGFSMSAYYFLARETERRSAAIFNILLFNLIVGGAACLALFLRPEMLGNIFQSEELTRLAPAIGVVVWLWVFSTFLETVAIANQETRLATAFIVLAQFSKTLLMVGAVVFFASVESFLYAAMLQGALQTVVLLVYLNARFPGFWKDFRPRFFVEQMIYAVPFGLAGILYILQNNIHNYFVGYKFSAAEFAVYAYGLFQVPLIMMLGESVASVLIPRMTELQAKNDKREMIRLTTRAMSKLAFVYFPVYVFLLITAQTFIVTLFTTDYLASVPIFVINLTLLPLGILITDPIVRAYTELGRFLLALRFFILLGLTAALYYGLAFFDMKAMIAVAVAAILIEKLVAETVIARKLGFGAKDFHLFKTIGKTAIISIIAGVATYFVYANTREFLFGAGKFIAEQLSQTSRSGVADFVGGTLTLAVAAAVYAFVYLFAAYRSGIIETEEKRQFNDFLNKTRSLLGGKTIAAQSQTLN